MLIGSRTPKELTKLLYRGYFTDGRRRITDESHEGGRPQIRLWDDWERRQSHIYASDIATLLEVAFLDISTWHWQPNEKQAQ